jgi:signal transduction histidine kinase
MLAGEQIINTLGLACITTIFALAVMLASKMQKLKRLQTEVGNLKKSLEEMDEQAKLVLRTDMELNKTQEELDKKIIGLYALQRLSRAISTALEESRIFKKIESSHLEDLGFEKAVACLWGNKETGFVTHLVIGYSEDESRALKSFIDSHKDLYLDLIRNERSFSSLSIPKDKAIEQNLGQAFKVKYFIISPILPKEGDKGFLFVGTASGDAPLTEGEEESITILANQLGQALENARLFEKTWRAHQELEKKVEERTRELTLALDEVRKISKRKTDFISSVSHELRTPLTSIKGYASILLAGKLGNIPADVHERLDKINRHSDELVHMVNDLLDISRIESGRVTMRQEAVALKNIIDQALDLLAGQLKDREIELSVEMPANANAVFVDRGQIERVFINIIGNAIKFTPPKGKISIHCHKINHEVQVDITDTGCGIPKEAQESIFEEFYRVDNPINQQVKGTGLGLALVKHLVEAHKGKIWVKSREGVGSTFGFTLPMINQ